MILRYHPTFRKSFRKLTAEQKDRVDRAIQIFEKNPFAPSLGNHGLKGNMKGIRSIEAGYDLRILYIERGGHAYVLFIRVGDHDDVYR